MQWKISIRLRFQMTIIIQLKVIQMRTARIRGMACRKNSTEIQHRKIRQANRARCLKLDRFPFFFFLLSFLCNVNNSFLCTLFSIIQEREFLFIALL